MPPNFQLTKITEKRLWEIILGSKLDFVSTEQFYLLNPLFHWEQIADFTKVSIQQAKKIGAVLEIGKRIFQRSTIAAPILNSPQAAFRHLKDMASWEQETIRVLYLDSKLQLIRDQIVAIGSLNTAHTHIREILRPAFIVNAHTYILAHNHPSGDKTPSQEDIYFTQQIVELSDRLGLPLQDHLVISQSGYTSLCQQFPELFLKK